MIHDKFYTNADIAAFCIEKLRPHIIFCDAIIEPSAGGGSFIFDGTTHAFDIAPEAENITQSSWFDVNLDEYHGSICVYGNPPFGKRNSLSKQFISHAINSENVDVIGFILPAVFHKHTLQSIFPQNWVLVEFHDLPNNSFTEDGTPYGIDTVFQIWVKNSKLPNLRTIPRTTFSNNHFSIVGISNANLFVMGAAPTVTKLPHEVTSSNRGYYLQSYISVDELRQKFYDVKWKGRSSAKGGVSWLTKSELVDNYERHHNDSIQK